VAVLVVVGAAWVGMLRYDHPSLAAWEPHVLPEASPEMRESVKVRYYGVSTLMFSDGDNVIIIDGFLTRPGGLLRLALGGEIEPDEEKIRNILLEDRVARADVVVCVHSHYDHSMDAPSVAARTGALLLGSSSTANVGRGWGLPEDQIEVAEPGVPKRFGKFEVTLIRSRHVPLPFAQDTIGRDIETPLVPPAAADEYLEGGSYSVLIEHPFGTALVQGSAGWEQDALADYEVDTVFLGIAGLAGQDAQYQKTYLDQVVGACNARRVIPIHYDDFTLELGGEMIAMPRLADDIPATLDAVYADTETRSIGFGLLPLRKDVVIFEKPATAH
jgi:L-ascorbate metabolism protein UlaG (beta-lactamase superfamily)